MTKNEKATIKDSILKNIDELDSGLKMLEKAAKPISPDSAYGRISGTDAINNKAIVDAALKDKTTTMHRLKYTLSRIDSGQYGLRAKCGTEIALKSLISIPYASLCINCAAK